MRTNQEGAIYNADLQKKERSCKFYIYTVYVYMYVYNICMKKARHFITQYLHSRSEAW